MKLTLLLPSWDQPCLNWCLWFAGCTEDVGSAAEAPQLEDHLLPAAHSQLRSSKSQTIVETIKNVFYLFIVAALKTKLRHNVF